jgi:hypothetical protein
MADKIESKSVVVARFRKSKTEKIYVSANEYNGRKYADLRTYFMDSEGEWHPTKKGISIPADLFNELVVGIKALSEEL